MNKNITNQEYAQQLIEEGIETNTQYKWNVQYISEYKVYLASFVDTEYERGRFWEVDLKNKIVRGVWDNWFLKQKYGITPLRDDDFFLLENVEIEKIINKAGLGIYYKIILKAHIKY